MKKIKTPKSLNFILWISFFFFALLTVVAFGLGEMTVLQQVSRERTVQNLSNAAKEITKELHGLLAWDTQISGYLISVSEEYDVTARIVSAEGVLLFPRLEQDTATDAEFAEEIPRMRENAGFVYQVDSNLYAYAGKIIINGNEAFIYLTDTHVLGKAVFGIMVFQTVYIAFIMLIIASVLSGAISMYVSRPIADLTEKARRMSSGNLSVNFTQAGGASYREIVELSDSLNYAESELSKANEVQKELIANVSHDFKTPLTMIKAYASMIQEISGDNPEKRAKHAQVIIDETDRLSSLVNDMLDLSKIRAGLESFKPTLFNLSDYLRAIVERFDYLRETSRYRFMLDIADDLYIEADKDKIGQVLYNLIGNAVNYTGEDKIVTVRLYGENGLAHFTVTDTGKGIPPEELSTIWERYYRARETHKRPVKGTGLGLSIVKTILVKHEFKFGVRSEVGKGSTFYVDFPVKPVAEIEE
ncbi:MAG: hypothetical protein IJY26_01025 [Clostridia bacterium]|nr:hypothetical protein [Clostridia bacterium]